MSDISIRVQNLSKRYRIGLKEEMHDTLAGVLTDLMTRPIRNLRRLRRLTRFDDDGNVQRSSVPTANASDIIWALKDISFEVKRGEVVGIIGRNGAGKSTLLKILSHITHPTSGRVELHGRVSSLLEVGTGFHPELTGRDNIYLNGTILGMTKAEIDKKFDEIVDFSGVEKFIDTPVKRYSSGMRVRLAFSVAAYLEPEILMVDEVLAVGDAAFQKKCLGKMGEVARKGRTVLFVSHNMIAIQGLCERAIWLENGRILEDGRPDKTVSEYLKTSVPDTITHRSWDKMTTAPGNDKVRLHRILIRPISGHEKAPLRVDQALEIIVEFWSLKSDQDLAITLHFIASGNVIAFSTSSIHNQSLRGSSLNHGLYKATCIIPAYYLNDENYRVKLMIIENQSRGIFSMEEALTFELHDTGGWREAYFGKRPGVVAPMLKWDMQCLHDETPAKISLPPESYKGFPSQAE